MNPLRDVERIRQRIIRGQVSELTRLRSYISMTEGNQVAVDALHGEAGNLVLAKVTDLILKELGHESETPVENQFSKVRRDVARVRGKASGHDED